MFSCRQIFLNVIYCILVLKYHEKIKKKKTKKAKVDYPNPPESTPLHVSTRVWRPYSDVLLVYIWPSVDN